MTLRTADFDYALPAELIAQTPPVERGQSRLLTLTGAQLCDREFNTLPGLLSRGDLLVFNDTRVMRARLFGHKSSGGKIECLVERILDADHAWVMFRASHAPRPGGTVEFGAAGQMEVLERQDDGFLVRLHLPDTDRPAHFAEWLERHGTLPLPPYIERPPGADDDQRYQTIYAAQPGAVAAPTAGLHFDTAMLVRLQDSGIERASLTLHVGAGTFQPVRVERIDEHRMHPEHYHLPETTVDAIERTRARGGRVIAVGTTTLRTLESASATGHLKAGRGETRLFITPGYRFRIVDRLLTNFHLPRSTLLMLVSAFAGLEPIRHAYQHAIQERYRFFSYGDAMLIDRQAIEDIPTRS